jgi:hypothetical protein
VSLCGLKPASDLRVKTGQGFDERVALFAGFSIGSFDRTRCAGLAGFDRAMTGNNHQRSGL